MTASEQARTMQTQVASIAPEDDLPHEPNEAPAWRESVYYEFLDPAAGVGSWQYIGERVNKNRAGLALGLWTADTGVYGRLEHSAVQRDDRSHECVGLKTTTIEPMRLHHITYSGAMVGPHRLADGDYRLPPAAMRPGASTVMDSVPVEIDLEWRAEGEAFTFQADLLTEYFAGHLEQFGRCRGTVSVDGRGYSVDAPAIRDRSWGERQWFGVDRYIFVWAPFKSGHMAVTQTLRHGVTDITGAVAVDGRMVQLDRWEDSLEWWDGPGKAIPRGGRITVSDVNGGHHPVEVELVAAVPSVFQDRSQNGRLAWIDRCVARFRRDGETVLGVLESQQVVDRPEWF